MYEKMCYNNDQQKCSAMLKVYINTQKKSKSYMLSCKI